MHQHYKHTKRKIILLSPHIDDIAFSMSGFLYQLTTKGYNIFLINIFNNSIYCLPEFKTACINKQREMEDQKFVKQFNLNKINLNLNDSSILKHTVLSETICVPNDFRRKKVYKLFVKIFNIIKPSKIFCPIGIGGHIDHRMVKEVCLEVNYNMVQKIFFYEDLPYVYNYTPKHISNIIEKTTTLKLVPQYHDISNIWLVKERSIAFYESQINQSIISSIKNYAKSLGNNRYLYERFWSIN
ncbi:MAG: PIG-L family deacetylase [Chitinophagaceae bacterium]|nr:PIG-L family deacetylase [Chitinophagaceae bacterium]